jgi:hypothetical protein
MPSIAYLSGAVFAATLLGAGRIETRVATADPEYVAIRMEIDVNRPAADVWAKVGGYCDLGKWLVAGREIPCVVTSGDGGIGTVRKIGTSVIEVLIAKTDLSYGYTQPAVEGKWYNLYHGFLEARPVSATTSKLIYTLLLDVSDKADQAAKDADIARRRATFEGALANMKRIAEGA